MKTVVMLPTYNERQNIKAITDEVLKQDAGVDVLIVDDASPDGTGDIADLISKDNPRVHVIHRNERGRGTAGLTGFKWALDNNYDLLVEMDADGSHDPAVIRDFMSEISDCDVVVGSRYVPGGGTEGVSPVRKLVSRVANAYARAVLGLPLADCTGGYKMFRVEVLKALDPADYQSDKNIYDGPETLLRVVKAGFRVEEIPITFQQRAAGESKITVNKIIRNIINHVRLRFKVGGV